MLSTGAAEAAPRRWHQTCWQRFQRECSRAAGQREAGSTPSSLGPAAPGGAQVDCLWHSRHREVGHALPLLKDAIILWYHQLASCRFLIGTLLEAEQVLLAGMMVAGKAVSCSIIKCCLQWLETAKFFVFQCRQLLS